MVTVIETVYRFLWGDLLTLPAGRRKYPLFASGAAADSYGNLFYAAHTFSFPASV